MKKARLFKESVFHKIPVAGGNVHIVPAGNLHTLSPAHSRVVHVI